MGWQTVSRTGMISKASSLICQSSRWEDLNRSHPLGLSVSMRFLYVVFRLAGYLPSWLRDQRHLFWERVGGSESERASERKRDHITFNGLALKFTQGHVSCFSSLLRSQNLERWNILHLSKGKVSKTISESRSSRRRCRKLVISTAFCCGEVEGTAPQHAEVSRSGTKPQPQQG